MLRPRVGAHETKGLDENRGFPFFEAPKTALLQPRLYIAARRR